MKSLPPALLLLLLAAQTAPAQWSNDPYENTFVSYEAFFPQMVSDGAGGAVIVYWSSSDGHLHAQRLNRYGYACWGEEGIIIGTAETWQSEIFSTCESENGCCIIAFYEYYGEYPYYFGRVHAQKLDSLGNKLWPEGGAPVCAMDSNYVGSPRAVTDGQGGAFVIWNDYRMGDYQVYGQRLDAEGNGQWVIDGIPISGDTGGINNIPAIISGGPGYALAFWHKEVNQLWAQRIDPEGNFCWGDTGIVLPETFGFCNTYIGDNQGGCIITALHSVGLGYEIFYAQRIDSLGSFLWGDSGLCVNDSSYYNSPRISLAQGQNHTYMAWHDDHLGICQVYMQRVNDNGEFTWGSSGLAITASDSVSTCPVITSSDTTDVIVAFLDQRDGGTLKAQKLDDLGFFQWDLNHMIFSHNNYYTDNLGIISDMAGGAIMSWTIYPALLYAQQISAEGNLGEVLAVQNRSPEAIPKDITLLPNFPNPFNFSTTLRFSLPAPSCVVLGVFDIAGRSVGEMQEGWYGAGVYRILFDGSDLPSGLYLARLEAKPSLSGRAGSFQDVRKLVLIK